MKTRKRLSKNLSLKRTLCMLSIGLLLVNCEKDELVQDETEELTSTELQWRKKRKIKICYTGRNGHCRIIKIPKWSWRWFKKYGAVRLDDQDGDGFVPDNACGFGQMGDCDDKDPNINPDAQGSCNNEIDTDGDGVIDSEDECPDEAGLQNLNGCPDADGDGVPDDDDECLSEAGPANNDGCPYPDTDSDGVLDRDDECPTEAGPAENQGCPEMSVQIGDVHAGGYIFYLARPNEDLNGDGIADMGLIAATADLFDGEITFEQWDCFGTEINGADGNAIGTGANNTRDIVTSDCQVNNVNKSAAELCSEYSGGGFNDWFLPSRDELNLMWMNLADSDGNGENTGLSDPSNIGGFQTVFYWSSTESHEPGRIQFDAWGQRFIAGLQDTGNKSNGRRVRPVRAF